MGKEGLQLINFQQQAKIDIALRGARQSFLRKDLERPSKDEAYDLEFDRSAYQTLARFQNNPEFEQAKKRLDLFTKRQVQTLLAEREHTLLSTNRLRIENGVVHPENDNEQFLDFVKRGRDYRRIHGNPIDFEREDAEVLGQEEIIGVLSNPNTKEGTMVLSISPKGGEGSSYQHNFFDVFSLKTEQDKKIIEIKRHSSSLIISEFSEKFTKLSGTTPFLLNGAFFLSHPLVLDEKFKSPQDVASFMGNESGFMPEIVFEQKILSECDLLFDAYINSLFKNPNDVSTHELIFRAILNKAEEIKKRLDGRENNSLHQSQVVYQRNTHQALMAEIYRLGNQKVKTVTTGCGSSGADSDGGLVSAIKKIFEIKLSSKPFGVFDFGKKEDDLGDSEFPCPVCGHKNIRPYNKKIPLCQNESCSDRTKVAC